MTVLTKAKKEKKKGFFREVYLELKKVSWTSKEELKIGTKIVIGATLVLGLSIYGVDLTIQSVLGIISHLAKLILG